MKLRNFALIIAGILIGIIYILIANSIKTTSAIWILTRAYGLIAFVLLFFLILIGELRLLGFNKLFKMHSSIGIITFYVVFLHFLSAVFDKFKWGKNLTFVDFLGFNFSDKWMIFLSLGTIAGYLIIVVCITSIRNNIQKLGFKNWKLVHFLGYLILTVVFVHSIILGTDVKTSLLRAIVFPIMFFCFSIVVGFLGVRMIKKHLIDRKETILCIFLVILLAIGITLFANYQRITIEKLNTIKIEKEKASYDYDLLKTKNQNLLNQINYIQKNINQISDQSDSFTKLIAEKKASETVTPAISAEETVNSIVDDNIEYEREEDD
jgi:methionine sulfoxide reductase heme-binding subunit